MVQRIVVVLFVICGFALAENSWRAEEETAEYWLNVGNDELRRALKVQRSKMKVAKNVIIFLGDGMSIPTITAGRILKGQMQGMSGEDAVLAMDQFPHVGLSKTYAVDSQVPDSASTATAFLCGVKGNFYTVGVSAAARLANCSSQKGTEVDSVLVDAFKAGKSTGIVTTTSINHATPAGAYAHSTYRGWYSDADLSDEAKANGCKDIAQQFYDNSDKITIALGGGRQYFQPNFTNDPEYPNEANFRQDGQDLIAKWLENHSLNGLKASYVWNQTAFDNVDPVTTDRLLGLFEPEDMHFEPFRFTDQAGEPSITEMTEKAIRILQKNSKGYFLLVEGGRIDHGHHVTNAYRALHDFLAFDNAVAKAVEMTSDSDTLIIVTSDHSHTFSFGGYPERGNPIFGLVAAGGELQLGLDGKPYTSLLYGNGPGYQESGADPKEPQIRQNLTGFPTDYHSFIQQSAVPLSFETHAGDDVAIMARGPMSHLFHGVHQQNYIATVMRYAFCIGIDVGRCKKRRGVNLRDVNSSARLNNTPISSPASTTFLGINLTSEEAATALNILFALVVFFFVFSLVMCFVVVIRKRPKYPKKSAGHSNEGFEN